MPLTRIKSSTIGTDAITSARIDDGAVATVDIADNAVTTAKLDDTSGGLTLPGNQFVGVPSGTTAQRPSSPAAGQTRFNTSIDSLEFYDGNAWVPTNLVPNVSGVTGTIKPGVATNIVVAVTNFTSSVSVRFTPTGGSSVDVSGLTGASNVTVAVPPALYNSYSAGNVVGIKVINADGTESNTVNTTIIALPSGGTITTSGNFRIHKFTSSGNFVNTVANLGVQYLIVGGGGGSGGGYQSGGGGGGGFRTNVTGATSGRGASAEAAMTLSSAATFAVTVGAGGAAGAAVTGSASASASGSQGGSSAFNSITSLGGGFGSSYWSPAPRAGGNGGCGGGAGNAAGTQSGGDGTAGQGYDGGDTLDYLDPYSGGGGGGAGANGGNASNNTAGNGGNGQASSITGSAVTYAGGGGGGGYVNSSGTGGTGGGANGTTGTGTAIAGADELGGGGGGIGQQGIAGGAGGSGIVIVRYDITTF